MKHNLCKVLFTISILLLMLIRLSAQSVDSTHHIEVVDTISTANAVPVKGQLTIAVTDSITQEKLLGVVVVLRGTQVSSATDMDGVAMLSGIPDGWQTFDMTYVGYQKYTLTIQFPISISQPMQVKLKHEQSELGEVLVTSTRTNSRIEDAPIKVEILGIEELTEESTLKPGNISSLLGDVSGVQIQPTSAVSGNSVVRMQGLDGRYTLLLRNGIPAYGALSTGLSILQIPPLDLKQIEIVKGPSSTINGGGAISGLINFIAKEPSDSTEATFLLNESSLLETNLNAYVSGKKDKIGYTLFTGGTYQNARDVNGDGFSDVPKSLSILVHPQLFFYPDSKTHIRVGFTGNYENRIGGDMKAIKGQSDSTHQYFEKSLLQNYGVDVSLNRDFEDKQGLYFKGSGNYFDRSLQTNYALQSGHQWTGYSELYYQIPKGRHNIIVGGNYLLDLFQKAPGDTSTYQSYTYHTVGLFAQYSYDLENKLNFQAGIRGDYHNKFGFFILPSAALLVHATKELSFRFNGGTGYKVPNILEILGLEEGINTIPANTHIDPERSYGGTAEWNYQKFFDKTGISIFVNQTFFYTWVQHAIITSEDAIGNYSITSVNQGATSLGVDNYIRMKKGPVDVYLGYTFTYPRKSFDKAQPYLTLTPLHRAAGVVSVDLSQHWKIGVEGSVMGRQYLDDGSRSKPYFLLASSIQYHIKRVTLVLNGENLLDVRQTRYSPVVYAPYTAHPRFAQLWAPVDGRVINFAVMIRI